MSVQWLIGLSALLFTTVAVKAFPRNDIVFVLDQSGSVGSRNFKIMLDKCKEIVDKHTVGSYATKFGLDKFSTSSSTEIKLKDYNNKPALKRAIGRVSYDRGLTKTHMALDRLRNWSFSSGYGHRWYAPKIAILMTDGKSQDKRRTIDAARRARKSGIKIIVIAIGHDIDWDEIIGIATRGTTAFRVNNFDALKMFDVKKISAAVSS